MESDVAPVKEQLTQALYDHIPVGVGSTGSIKVNERQLDAVLERGIDWCIKEGYAWPEDKEHCEEFGRMRGADPSKVSNRAKKRGLPQLGTLVRTVMVVVMVIFRVLVIIMLRYRLLMRYTIKQQPM